MTWAITQKNYSQRRACRLVGLEPKTYRYVSQRPGDGEIRARLRVLAGERRRFGYRRLHILLARDGVRLNHKRLFRLYREEKLGVRKRGGRKRALGTRSPMALPEAANQHWSLDFVSDALSNGRRFRILAVVDDFTRECLGLVADTSLSGLRVGRELDGIIERRGCRPAMVVSDNGTELTSHAILRWQEERRVLWHYIAPGKPQQNGHVGGRVTGPTLDVSRHAALTPKPCLHRHGARVSGARVLAQATSGCIKPEFSHGLVRNQCAFRHSAPNYPLNASMNVLLAALS